MTSRSKTLWRFCLTPVIALVLFTSLLGQNGQQLDENCGQGPLNTFFVIDIKRNALQTEVAQRTAKRKEIQEITLPQSEKTESDLAETNKKIELLRQKSDKSSADQSQLKDLESLKSSTEGLLRGKTTDNLNQLLIQLEKEISDKQEQFKCVDNKIQEYSATPAQDFKRTLSMIFSALIGLVILGFFAMAWIDPTVRRAIFSGQTGLQFVTLFSIVIAIILFGITGILEGKELAALLGGLSGYILGRISSPSGVAGRSADTVDDGQKAKIKRIQVSPASLTLTKDERSASVSATAFDVDNKELEDLPAGSFNWGTDNAQVATVDRNGVVKRVGVGECRLTAIAGTVSSNAVTVKCE